MQMKVLISCQPIVNLPGGFHGTLDRQGQPMAPTDKTIVQQVCYLKVPAVQGQLSGSSLCQPPPLVDLLLSGHYGIKACTDRL
jgi:hypothetical protein